MFRLLLLIMFCLSVLISNAQQYRIKNAAKIFSSILPPVTGNEGKVLVLSSDTITFSNNLKGNVGIYESVPFQPLADLHIYGIGSTYLRLSDSCTTDTCANVGIEFYRNLNTNKLGEIGYLNNLTPDLYVRNSIPGGNIEFATDGFARVKVLRDGNLQINNTIVADNLPTTVRSSNILVIENDSLKISSADLSGGISFFTKDAPNNEVYLTNTTDQFGIGTVNPNASLDVEGEVLMNDIRIRTVPINTTSWDMILKNENTARTRLIIEPGGTNTTGAAFLVLSNSSPFSDAGQIQLGVRDQFAVIQAATNANALTAGRSVSISAIELDPLNLITNEEFVIGSNAIFSNANYNNANPVSPLKLFFRVGEKGIFFPQLRSFTTQADAVSDITLQAGSMFKVSNGNGTSTIYIKD